MDILASLQKKEAEMKRQKGFTLIELMVVMAVLAILVGVVLPGVTGVGTTGKGAGRDADVREIQQAVQRFNTDTGLWPTADGSKPTTDVNEGTNKDTATSSMLKVISFTADLSSYGTTKKLYPDYMTRVPANATDDITTAVSGSPPPRSVNGTLAAATPIIQPDGTTLTLAASQTFTDGAYVLDKNGKVWVLINAVEY